MSLLRGHGRADDLQNGAHLLYLEACHWLKNEPERYWLIQVHHTRALKWAGYRKLSYYILREVLLLHHLD